jgi:hypothetical protein
MKIQRLLWMAAFAIARLAVADESAGPAYVPYHSSSIYALGETAGWNVTLPWKSPTVSYVIRKNNLDEIGRGTLTPGKPSTIEAKLDGPGMVYVEVTENTPNAKPRALGAAVAPEKESEDRGPAQSARRGRTHGKTERKGRRRFRHPQDGSRRRQTRVGPGREAA